MAKKQTKQAPKKVAKKAKPKKPLAKKTAKKMAKKKVISESAAIQSMIGAIFEKDYSTATKYLKLAVESKIRDRIKAAVAQPIF